eukprot:3237263-Amphidinium_carterae.1
MHQDSALVPVTGRERRKTPHCNYAVRTSAGRANASTIDTMSKKGIGKRIIRGPQFQNRIAKCVAFWNSGGKRNDSKRWTSSK